MIRSYFVAIIAMMATLFVSFDLCISKATVPDQGVTWSFDNGTLTISGTGAMEDYYLKTAPWFSSESFAEGDIKSVVINDGITYIGRCAFMQLTGVESIKLPTSLQVIGENAFANCSSLKTVDFPSELTKISSGAFSDCTSLTELKLPDNIEIIEMCCFQGCTSLIQCEISKGISKIPSYAFETCKALTDITIPEGVTEIEPAAFAFCESLKRVTLPSTLETLGSRKSSYAYAGAFHGCKNLEAVNLPDRLKLIGESAFMGTNLKGKLSIPEGVETICYGAFTTLDPMEGIVLPESLTDIEDYFINSKTVVYCSNDPQVEYCKKMYYSYVDTRIPPTEENTGSDDPTKEDGSTEGNSTHEALAGETVSDKEKDQQEDSITDTDGKGQIEDNATETPEASDVANNTSVEQNVTDNDMLPENKASENASNGSSSESETKTSADPATIPQTTDVPTNAKKKLEKITGFSCLLNEDLTVDLKWKRSKTAGGYELMRSTKKNSGYKRLTVLKNPKSTSFTDRKAKSGKTYYYRIRAVDGDRTGAFSSIRSVKLPWLITPTFTLNKGRTATGGKCVELKLEKYQGTGLEVYVSLNGGSFRKLRLEDNRISKLGDRIKLSYSKKAQLYSFKLRTFKKVGKTTKKSNYSRMIKIRT
ncbi:MAG: leucine-rich repeat protein [Lachnospiraceae bacterium]|nr:leucine-rich repeat protein [Lachnospiraceae bacterium]